MDLRISCRGDQTPCRSNLPSSIVKLAVSPRKKLRGACAPTASISHLDIVYDRQR